jgi:hypothetical protein
MIRMQYGKIVPLLVSFSVVLPEFSKSLPYVACGRHLSKVIQYYYILQFVLVRAEWVCP